MAPVWILPGWSGAPRQLDCRDQYGPQNGEYITGSFIMKDGDIAARIDALPPLRQLVKMDMRHANRLTKFPV